MSWGQKNSFEKVYDIGLQGYKDIKLNSFLKDNLQWMAIISIKERRLFHLNFDCLQPFFEFKVYKY